MKRAGNYIRSNSANLLCLWSCLAGCLVFGGCSTLGLSLYPSNSMLTQDAEAVLDSSKISPELPRENAKAVLPPHALEPGDSLLIEPVNMEFDLRLPADQVVLADGTVDLGPFGRVVVAGRDLEQAESLIEQQIVFQLQQQREACEAYNSAEVRQQMNAPRLPENCDAVAINVRILEPVHRFYVLGEVNAPGSYPLAGYETVLDAIVTAGGLTSGANPCKILLARPTDPCECRVTLPVCYREIVQLGNTASNYQLQPGDRVFVASRTCMDELMFWKATETCERCASCNRACKVPSAITARPMPSSENTMIQPGSVAWMKLNRDPLRSGELVETELMQSSAGKQFRSPSASEGVSIAEPVSPIREPVRSDIDGELDFPSLSNE